MRKLLAVILFVAVLLVGCSCSNTVPPANTAPTNGGPTVSYDEPPADRTWISPGKVHISNFYPGARAEYPLTIHNGREEYCTFEISYKVPNRVEEGYAVAPANFGDWVIIADMTPILAPRETRDILIVVDMPKNATGYPMKFEFWVAVKDLSQTGAVRTEMASRWLVSMSR